MKLSHFFGVFTLTSLLMISNPLLANTMNPFAKASALPYELPDFAQIKDDDFMPAFKAGMAEQLKEVAQIVNQNDAPTFDNTVVALERSGALLQRVSKVFFILVRSDGNATRQKIEEEVSPLLSAQHDAIQLNPALFARIKSLYLKREELGLDPESTQLLARTYNEFVQAGASLSEPDKNQLKAINEKLSKLSTQFRQNVLKSTQAGAVLVIDKNQLAGLSEAEISAAASTASARGLPGQYLLALQNTSTQRLLAKLQNRDLREKLYRASIDRAWSGPFDNREVVVEIMRLRNQRSQLLGFATPADEILLDTGAKTPKAVNEMLSQIAPLALAAARKEGAQIQALINKQAADGQGMPFELQPWDWDFYADQILFEQYSVDPNQVKPYFELNRVLVDGAFYAAQQLFGLSFKARNDLKGYRPDVRVFEVFDADGSGLGLFLFDPFARDNKQGGAWMNSIVNQSTLFKTRPVVLNNLNVPFPGEGVPVLLTFDEVTTLFHEFGHALHGLLSNVRYSSLSGTRVPRDFGEYPSQYNEMWARDPEVVKHFAHHHQSGEPLPTELLNKVIRAQKFDQGFATTSYVASAVLDQAWHQLPPSKLPQPDQVMAFENKVLRDAGFDYAPVTARYRSTYFSHIYSGGYAASYYAYLWSEVLARDTGEWLIKRGGLKRANGDVLRAKILSRGRSQEPNDLFEAFYGAPPNGDALLEYRGLK